MKRRLVARTALVAAGALALVVGSAGAHPSDSLVDDGFLNSALDEHQTYGHGAAGSVDGRKKLPCPRARTDSSSSASPPRRARVRRRRPRRRRLGQGQLRLPDDVLRAVPAAAAACRSWTSPTRRTRSKKGFVPSHTDTFSGEGSQVVSMDTASFKGDLLVYQNEWCPEHDQRRRRHHARGREQPELAQEARRGRGRLHQEDGDARQGRPADQGQPDALRVRVEAEGRRGNGPAGTSCWSTTLRSPTSTSSTSPTRPSRRWSTSTNLDQSPRPARAGRTATPSSATT